MNLLVNISYSSLSTMMVNDKIYPPLVSYLFLVDFLDFSSLISIVWVNIIIWFSHLCRSRVLGRESGKGIRISSVSA